jgi:CheY-like chemotaxis protein
MPSVLLADDEFLIRAAMVDALNDLGIDCIEAATGRAALDALAGDGALAAVIVDIGLPDMSGEKVIEAALRQRPGLPVVRCSGGDAASAADDPRIRVFAKPCSAVDLARFVASLVGKA